VRVGHRAAPDRLTAHTEEAMITGTIIPDRQVAIWLPVRVPEERKLEIEAVIDTSLSDFITLPPAVTLAPDLNLHPMSPCELIESGEEAR
jgi:hypothetical protein